DLEPMLEVLAHVVSAEGQHRHWVTPHLADSTNSGGGHFRAHGCADIRPMFPIACLKDERHGVAAPPPENDGTDGNAAAILNTGLEHRVIPHRSGEPAVRMPGFLSGSGRPIGAAPRHSVRRWRPAFACAPRS